MQKEVKKVQIFGELELNLDLDFNGIWEQVKDISENCGYEIDMKDDQIWIISKEGEIAKIMFDDGLIVGVSRSLDNGLTWELYSTDREQFQVSIETLKKYAKRIDWYNLGDELPYSQGYLINHLIKLYKMPAQKIGYKGDLIAVKTKKQTIVWRDTGVGAEFLGLLSNGGDAE